jgi:hypothetical protein
MAATRSLARFRRGVTADFTGVVLEDGEFSYDTTLKILKVGDGVTVYASLPSLVDLV